ncbi:MAG: transglutaminase domain-containing protein [Oscillospiraceae bacterium]|nr:transglutaminase domain-containing protein [Oscillospiraceae bacterium]
MKKTLSWLVILCIIVPMCFVSCAKKDEGGTSAVSSGISYQETSSEIAKTEGDGEFTFAFDPYVLPLEIKSALGSTSYYKAFVDAVLASEERVSVPSRDYYDKIRFAMGECFPFSALVSGYRYDNEKNQILISYNYTQTHIEKINNFEKSVQEIFDECVKNTDGDVMAAISLYSWISQNITITQDNTVSDKPNDDTASSEIASDETEYTQDDENEIKSDIYNTLIEKKGTAASVASLYNFLLMQLGIECKTVSGWNSQSYKTWNMLELDSKWYHCDITSEQKETDGEGLKYFGMTEKMASEIVGGNEIYTGQFTWFTSDLPKSNSTRFKDFVNIVSWEMNTNRDGIVAFTDEYSRFSWNIKD